MEPLSDGERVEFVPWDQIRTPNREPWSQRRLIVIVVAVVGVVLVGAAWWLFDRPASSDPGPTAPPEVALVETSVSVPLTTINPPAGYTEADLRAIAPDQSAGAVATVAAEFLRAYLSDTDPAIHPFGVSIEPLYVEWLLVVSTDEGSAPGQSIVTMRVGLLELGEEPRRLPVSEYAVVVSEDRAHNQLSIPIRRDMADNADFVVEDRSLTEVPASVLANAPVEDGEEVLGGWTDGAAWYVLVLDRYGTPVAIEVTSP